MNRVIIDNKVKKKFRKLPKYIVKSLQRWALQVEELGIEEVRKIPGRHDEPLDGDRKGQRSVRLSKAYRAFYVEYEKIEKESHVIIKIVNVIEVNKHEY